MRIEACALSIILSAATLSSALHAQTTAFTYQGELNAGGVAADGNFDLRFALFANAAGGTQIGSTRTVAALPVVDGLFTVQLDFGVDAFPGADRFVEIAVRPAGVGSFTTLAPRQQISSTPYAIRTLVATNAEQLGGLPANRYVQSNASGNVGIGTANPTNGKLAVIGGASSAVYGESTSGRGVWGKSTSSRGVYGESESFQGVYGISGTQAGVAGESASFHGVFGSAHDQNSAGVYGTNDDGGSGVSGVSTTGTGVFGESTSGRGVFGKSATEAGVFGESTSFDAVVGASHASTRAGVYGTNDAAGGFGLRGITSGTGGGGVYGESATGRGVWGKSVSSRGVYGESESFQGVFGISNTSIGVQGESTGTNGFGVYGKNLNGFAMGAEGNVTQNRDKGGWVKALLYVTAAGTVQRCFNSFLAAAAASTPPCGFEVIPASEEDGYSIKAPFVIGDRFLQVTPALSPAFIRTVANFDYLDNFIVFVHVFSVEDPEDRMNADFMLTIY